MIRGSTSADVKPGGAAATSALSLRSSSVHNTAAMGLELMCCLNLKQTNSLFNYHTPSVGIFEGYLEVPEDDIYEFSTDTDEFYIAGELLIDNDGEVKRYSRNDASIALRKGLHPVKMVFVNNVYGGWPQAWNGFRISYKRRGDSGVVKLQPEDFVH